MVICKFHLNIKLYWSMNVYLILRLLLNRSLELLKNIIFILTLLDYSCHMLSLFSSMPCLSSRQLIRKKDIRKASSRANFRIPGGMSQPDSTNKAVIVLEAHLHRPFCEATAVPFLRERQTPGIQGQPCAAMEAVPCQLQALLLFQWELMKTWPGRFHNAFWCKQNYLHPSPNNLRAGKTIKSPLPTSHTQRPTSLAHFNSVQLDIFKTIIGAL